MAQAQVTDIKDAKKTEDHIATIISHDKAIKRGDPLRWVRAGKAALDWYEANPGRDKNGLAIPGSRAELANTLKAKGREIAASTLQDYEALYKLYIRAKALFGEPSLTIVNLRDLARAMGKVSAFNGSFAIKSLSESQAIDITE